METELKMTEYERRRLENVKRNVDMMSSLKINSILSNLYSSSLKRPRPYTKAPIKYYEKSRSSFRTQGIPPSHPTGLTFDIKPSRIRSSDNGPIKMRNVYEGDEESHQSFVETLSSLGMNSVNNVRRMRLTRVKEPVKVESFKLVSENTAQILPNRPSVIRFFPTSDITMVVVGSKSGHLGFWEVKAGDAKETQKGVHIYHPFSAAIHGVSVHSFSPTKLYSCCNDGLLQLMNIEREEFEVVYSSNSESSLYSLSQQPNDANSIFFGEGRGALNMYDVRAGKIINSWLLHEDRINSTDTNPANTNVISTASGDGLACLWDLRKMNDQHSEYTTFNALNDEQTLQSAYFSPSGSHLAITSSVHNVAVLSGANFEDVQIIHDRHFCNSLHSIRSSAIWGWDDTYLYMGCSKRRVKVLSVPQKKTVCTLESPSVVGIPCQIAAHPSTIGMLAGVTSMGTAVLWPGGKTGNHEDL